MKRLKTALLLFALTNAAATAQTADSATAQAPDAASTLGVYKVGNGVTAPRAIYMPNPDFSQEARDAHYQGTCVLALIVGADGLPHNIRVTAHLGMGLDEKAVEAVQKWRFEPGRKNGEPVAVRIAVEVEFHLYGKNDPGDDPRVAELKRKADAGDAHAQLDLAHVYFEGKETTKNYTLANVYLYKAAYQGLLEAQFEIGDALARRDPPDYPKAYMWCTLADRGGYKPSRKALEELIVKMTPDQQQQGRALADGWTASSK
jgi:TonB family protein